jgi:hypothetical protein
MDEVYRGCRGFRENGSATGVRLRNGETQLLNAMVGTNRELLLITVFGSLDPGAI